MKVISALLCVGFVAARTAPNTLVRAPKKDGDDSDDQWAKPVQPRRQWYPGWNGYEDVPAYENVATPWAAEAPPPVWAEVENPLPGMVSYVTPEAQPVMIEGMAGVQAGVQYAYYEQTASLPYYQQPAYQQPASLPYHQQSHYR